MMTTYFGGKQLKIRRFPARTHHTTHHVDKSKNRTGRIGTKKAMALFQWNLRYDSLGVVSNGKTLNDDEDSSTLPSNRTNRHKSLLLLFIVRIEG
jgi:hypothetical protein